MGWELEKCTQGQHVELGGTHPIRFKYLENVIGPGWFTVRS